MRNSWWPEKTGWSIPLPTIWRNRTWYGIVSRWVMK
jgi:hypothetical protein